MAEIDEIRASFARRAVAAGVATYDDDGRVRLPDGTAVRVSPGEAAVAQEARPPVPSRVDLASGKPEHTITLRRVSTGETIEVHPLIRTGAVARERDWYARRIAELEPLLLAEKDKLEFDVLNSQVSTLIHEQAQLMIPDLPAGLLDDLSPGMDKRLMDMVTAIILEDMGDAGPNPDAQANP
jgi:hypothetical protein